MYLEMGLSRHSQGSFPRRDPKPQVRRVRGGWGCDLGLQSRAKLTGTALGIGHGVHWGEWFRMAL